MMAVSIWLLWLLFQLTRWLLSVAFGYLFFALLAVSWRWIRISCSRRIKPNRRKALLITGSTSGIGLAVAKHFHRLGFAIIGAYYNDQEDGYQELKRLPPSEMLLVKMDVTSQESIGEASGRVEEWLEANGIKLFALVNNAGSGRAGPFEWTSRESINCVLDTNLKGVMLVTRQFVHHLAKSGEGRVINVGSSLSYITWPGASVYGSTKSAINNFSESLDMDLEPYGVRCCCVLPGNLMAVSNIVYSRAACFQQSVKQLSEEERATYSKSIHFYGREVYAILTAKLRRSGDAQHARQVASFYGFDLPKEVEAQMRSASSSSSAASKKESRTKARVEGPTKKVSKILDLMDGRAKGLEEEEGVMGPFEDVLLVASSPPWRTYPGNRLFAHLVGPLLEHLTAPMLQLAKWLPRRNARLARETKIKTS